MRIRGGPKIYGSYGSGSGAPTLTWPDVKVGAYLAVGVRLPGLHVLHSGPGELAQQSQRVEISERYQELVIKFPEMEVTKIILAKI